MCLDCVKFQHFCGSPSLVVVNRSNVPLYCSSPISMTTSRRLRPKWILRSEEKAKYEVTKPELGKAVTGIQQGSLKGQIGADTKDMDEEKSAKAANEEQKTTDSGDLTMTEGYR